MVAEIGAVPPLESMYLSFCHSPLPNWIGTSLSGLCAKMLAPDGILMGASGSLVGLGML